MSELSDLTINVRGPAIVAPRRRYSSVAKSSQNIPLRALPREALARLAQHGGGMEPLVERARKIVSHRVPMLIAGEPGLDTAGFAKALLGDLGLASPMAKILDAAHRTGDDELQQALAHVSFLREFPIQNCTPVLVVLNADCLDAVAQHALETFLRTVDCSVDNHDSHAVRPILIFTAGRRWCALQDEVGVNQDLLYLVGQSVIELPPLRQRKVDVVIDSMVDDGVEISEPARQVLLDYDWPGNLREWQADQSHGSAAQADGREARYQS